MSDRPCEIQFVKNHPDAILPTKAHLSDSGWDLYCVEEFTIYPGKTSIIDTGLLLGNLTSNYELQVRARSGLAAKSGVIVVNAPGTIDCNYRGPIKVILSTVLDSVTLPKHSMIAQLCVCDVPFSVVTFVDKVCDSDRGNKGFGSSGR